LKACGDYELTTRTIASQIGAASALKMSYAGITKGLAAIAAATVLAATRAGAAPALREELEASQPQLLQRFTKTLPDMYPKAYRWVPKCARSRSLPRKMLPLAECTTHLRIYTSDWPLITGAQGLKLSLLRCFYHTRNEGQRL
jgi:Domain of unknown function (DUF1932)